MRTAAPGREILRVRLAIVILAVGACIVLGWANFGGLLTYTTSGAAQATKTDLFGAASLVNKAECGDDGAKCTDDSDSDPYGLAAWKRAEAKAPMFLAPHPAESHAEAINVSAATQSATRSRAYRKFGLPLIRLVIGLAAVATSAIVLVPLLFRTNFADRSK